VTANRADGLRIDAQQIPPISGAVQRREDRWLASAIGLAACLDARKRFAADGLSVSGFERGLRAVQALEHLGLQFLFGSAFFVCTNQLAHVLARAAVAPARNLT
jgi:hypothetical protein